MDVGSWKQRLPNVIYTNETLYIPIIVLPNAPYICIYIYFFLGGGGRREPRRRFYLIYVANFSLLPHEFDVGL